MKLWLEAGTLATFRPVSKRLGTSHPDIGGMTRTTTTLILATLVAMPALAPAGLAQPAGAGPPSEGPGGTDGAEGGRGLDRGLDVVPDFAAAILETIRGWFLPG